MNEEKVEKKVYDIRSMDELEREIARMLLLADKDIVRVLCAIVISQVMRLDTIWLMLTSNSGGGKTELLNIFSKIKYVFPIDTITPNTFLSGLRSTGKETSLLRRIQNGIFFFKDFSTILERNEADRREIMSQLRRVYDGHMVKTTGQGETLEWKGRVGAIACTTSDIYAKLASMASMGERFVMYEMIQPPRKDATRKAFDRMEDNSDPSALREEIQDAVLSYITNIRRCLTDNPFSYKNISNEIKEEIIEIADFCSQARTGLTKDEYRHTITHISSKEMPTRMAIQFHSILMTFIAIDRAENDLKSDTERIGNYDGKLRLNDKNIVIKIALSSIPEKRRKALQALAQYEKGITAAGLATHLGYETEVMKETLAELNALKLCHRQKFGDTNRFVLNKDWTELILRVEHIKQEGNALEATDFEDEEDTQEAQDELNEAFESGAYFTPPQQ
jgi:ribonuclease HII